MPGSGRGPVYFGDRVYSLACDKLKRIEPGVTEFGTRDGFAVLSYGIDCWSKRSEVKVTRLKSMNVHDVCLYWAW